MTQIRLDLANGNPERHDFVPGIYNYCDHWCARCPFQNRCLTHAMHLRMEQAVAQGQQASMGEILDDLLGPRPEPPAWMAELENTPPTPEETARIETHLATRDALSETDDTVLAAREYGQLAHSLAYTLGSDSRILADPVLSTAVETIAWHALLIAAKTHRAVSGLATAADDDWDEDEVQNDGNGSAKLCRLVLAESRDAWESFMHAEHAVADGVPAAMIKRLDDLDAQLARKFPQAMQFIRPGFDEEAPQG